MKRLFKIILLAIIVNCQSSMVSETHAQTVRDRYNAQIGRVESDGTVRDRYNAQIGKAAGVEPRIAAVIFFMQLLQLN